MKKKKCDRKCVAKVIARASRRHKGADFWIPSGATNMLMTPSMKRYTGWPNLRFKIPRLKKDGTPAKGKFTFSYYRPEFCPVCSGAM